MFSVGLVDVEMEKSEWMWDILGGKIVRVKGMVGFEK